MSFWRKAVLLDRCSSQQHVTFRSCSQMSSTRLAAVLSRACPIQAVTTASIARYLELPHETTRRYLKTVVDLGLLAQDGRSYKPTERSRKRAFNADKIERLLRQAARELYL